MGSATTQVFDNLINTTGNITGSYFIGDGSLLTGISSSYLSKWTTGNFEGSLYTTGPDSSLSDSNSLFQVLGSDGTPRFQVQNGGDEQASFITKNFLVINQNNTLLNQSQNNLCSDWGFFHIDCNVSIDGADLGVQDDLEVQDKIFANGGLRAHTSDYGAYFSLLDPGEKYSGNNGSYIAENKYFCDYDSDNFVNTGGWIVLGGEGTEYEDAPADLGAFVNSSCYQLKNNPTWANNFSNMDWKVIDSPINIVTKGGFSEFYVGSYSESQFKIKIENGTGFHGVSIDDMVGVNQHQAFTIDIDSKNFDGIVGANIFLSSSTGVEGIASKILALQSDLTGFNNSLLHFININSLGLGNNNDVDVINIEGNVDHIIHAGSEVSISKVYYDDISTTADVTTDFISQLSDASIFENDNSIIYVGNDLNFTTIGISLTTEASGNLDLEYYYCNGDNSWVTLPGVVDTTNGMQTSGIISFQNPSDRGVCNEEIDSTAFTNTTDYTYVAIKRTRNFVVTTPVENLVSISGGGGTFLLTEKYLKLNGVSIPPLSCSASFDGTIYYDSDLKKHCSCDATNWVQMDDYTTICS